jgi:hypothetical protein
MKRLICPDPKLFSFIKCCVEEQDLAEWLRRPTVITSVATAPDSIPASSDTTKSEKQCGIKYCKNFLL